MLVMAVPMVVRFDVAIQVARLVDKRRARRAALGGSHDVDDDQASSLDAAPSPLEDEPGRLVDGANSPPR